jgi:hypothetical protein
LTTGGPFSFTQKGCERSVKELLPCEKTTIALAVAASSAFPAFFEPIHLSADDLGVDVKTFGITDQYLTDGGVYDNLGLEHLDGLLQAGSIDFGIVSDAGAAFEIQAKTKFSRVLRSSVRSNDILMKRVGDFVLEKSTYPNRDPDTKVYRDALNIGRLLISMSVDIDCGRWPDAPSLTIQDLLRRVRTDFDRFTELEINALVHYGYCAARSAFDIYAQKFGMISPEIDIPVSPYSDADSSRQEKELKKSAKHKTRIASYRSWATAFSVILLIFYGLLGWVGYKAISAPSEIDLAAMYPRRFDFSISYSAIGDRWYQSLTSVEQNVVDAYKKTGIKPVSLADTQLVEEFDRYRDASDGKGVGTARMNIQGDGKSGEILSGIIEYRFPKDSDDVILEFKGVRQPGANLFKVEFSQRPQLRGDGIRPYKSFSVEMSAMRGQGGEEFTGYLQHPTRHFPLGGVSFVEKK